MGYSDATVIKDAGNYLLTVLLNDNSVPYSRFYDGKDETHFQLCEAIGLLDDDGEVDDWYSAEQLIDLAVAQLEEQGIVTIETLTAKLADGYDDYLICLTEDGRQKLASGYQPTYRDME